MIDNDDRDGKRTGDGAHGDGLDRLVDLFERSPVALTLADLTEADAPLVIANSAFLDLSGYPRDEVIGRNCRFLQADLPNADARAEARTLIAHGGPGQVVFRNRRKTGETFDNMLFLQALTTRDGRRRYVVGSQFLLDAAVTDRRIDTHLAEIDATLARMVAAQTALRAEQRRMLANAAHAVAAAWLTLRS